MQDAYALDSGVDFEPMNPYRSPASRGRSRYEYSESVPPPEYLQLYAMEQKKNEMEKKQLAVARTVSLVLGFVVLGLALGWLAYEIWYWNEWQQRTSNRTDFWEYLRRRFNGQLDEDSDNDGESGSRSRSKNKQGYGNNGAYNGYGMEDPSSSSRDVSVSEFMDLIGRDEKATVVLWHSHQCPGCQAYRPVFENIAEAVASEPYLSQKVDLISIDDKEFLRKIGGPDGQNLAAKYDVNGIPCVLAFRGGELVGKMPKLNLEPNQLVNFIQDQVLPS